MTGSSLRWLSGAPEETLGSVPVFGVANVDSPPVEWHRLYPSPGP